MRRYARWPKSERCGAVGARRTVRARFERESRGLEPGRETLARESPSEAVEREDEVVESKAMRPTREWRLVDGRPDPDQLAGVIAPIIQQIQPDLVILFGSTAGDTMTADSDVDLVVVKDAADLRGLAAGSHGCVPEPHPPLDIVPATRELLRNHRHA